MEGAGVYSRWGVVSEYGPGEASALLAGFVAGSRVAGYQLEGQLGALATSDYDGGIYLWHLG